MGSTGGQAATRCAKIGWNFALDPGDFPVYTPDTVSVITIQIQSTFQTKLAPSCTSKLGCSLFTDAFLEASCAC
eukprot:1159795-Pelagomonas_calceolata.AAC.5